MEKVAKKTKLRAQAESTDTASSLSDDGQDGADSKRSKTLDFEIKKPGTHAKVIIAFTACFML